MPTDDEGFRILDFSTPVPLADGGSWTAALQDWDRWREFTLRFAVSVQRPDGAADELALVLIEPSDWAAEPARTRRSIHLQVCGHYGIRP
jgi:hypothetical protein